MCRKVLPSWISLVACFPFSPTLPKKDAVDANAAKRVTSSVTSRAVSSRFSFPGLAGRWIRSARSSSRSRYHVLRAAFHRQGAPHKTRRLLVCAARRLFPHLGCSRSGLALSQLQRTKARVAVACPREPHVHVVCWHGVAAWIWLLARHVARRRLRRRVAWMCSDRLRL